MNTFTRCFFSGLIILFSSLVVAQTPYGKIEVGNVVEKGVEMGIFLKPIPLPEGQWLVVSKHVEELKLGANNKGTTGVTPQVFLTLKNNNAANSPLFAIVMWFTPEASNINWGRGPCADPKNNALVDDFGYSTNSPLFVCGMIWSQPNWKKWLVTAPHSANKWVKDNLAGLAAFQDDVADDVLEANIFGDRYAGRRIGFTFLLKLEGDVKTDPAYANYVKDWVHATGLALADVIKNDATTFALPKPYVAK